MVKTALKNPVSVIVLAVILFITGLVSFITMRRESFPETKIPYIFVTTLYPGANPPEIENLITQKIEDKLEGLDGVEQMTSSSNESFSNIFLEFDPSVKVEDALRRVKDKVDQARGELPADAEDPITQELNFSSFPIANISLYADYELERLESVAENLRDRLAKIPGVLEAKVKGKRDREIAVDVDPALLKQYDISLYDITQAISTQHMNIPGGTMRASGFRFSVKVTGELESPEQFNDLVVTAKNGRILRVKDVAKVSFTYTRDQQSISRTNGKPSLTLSIAKRTGEDIVRITEDAKKILIEEEKRWPAGTHYEITYEEAKHIKAMVDELQNHLLMGIVLVLLVLSFFLGARNSIFISTAIPFSMALGFIVLSYMGVTLNMVVLFSTIMALGMLVDDGIVVVENIYRHLQMGKGRFQAALDGTKEVMVPVFTATLTTIAAFAPVLWMPGIMGNFLKYLPMTVGITLTGSLFVAFVFNPVFASLTMNDLDAKRAEGSSKGAFERFKDFYRRTLKSVLHRPWTLAVFCLLFVISGIVAYSVFGPGTVFFPNVEPQVASVQIEGPLSQEIEITDAAIRGPEALLMSLPHAVASVKTVATIVGSGAGSRMSDGSAESNKGYVELVFEDYDERKVSSYKTMAFLEDTLPDMLPGWKVQVVKQEMGPPVGKPIELEVSGDDYHQLSILADSVKKLIETIPSLTNVSHDYDPARPEVRVSIDREQAKRLGFSTLDVAGGVRGAIYGSEAGKYRVGKDEYKIMVRYAPEVRENLNGLNEIVISKEGKDAPLPSLATISQGANIASIKHVDGKRTIQVLAELAPGQKDERGPKKEALDKIAGLQLPSGYTVRPGSGNRMQAESQEFIIKAFFIAISLVFLIMVFQFNSLFQPFLILIGIMISVGGVFWGLFIINEFNAVVSLVTGGKVELKDVTFSILFSGVGIIALAGVVAKNSIVLIDFMNRLRKAGRSIEDAVIEGGATRLRPVLLTAITAMIGLVPMATGVGIDFIHFGIVTRSETTMWWAPMAWAIFWGLLFNTMLVLVVTPTFYYAWENMKEKRKSRNVRKLES